MLGLYPFGGIMNIEYIDEWEFANLHDGTKKERRLVRCSLCRGWVARVDKAEHTEYHENLARQILEASLPMPPPGSRPRRY
jgi:hypothetical protein